MSEFPGDETFEQETGADPGTNGYPEDDPLGLEGGPAFEGDGDGPEPDGEPDPFATVPPIAADPDALPPGVQQGSLGGESPSEMAPIDPEAEPPYEGGKDLLDPPPAAPEPGPGDIADDEPDPLAPEDIGLGDEPPVPGAEPDPEPIEEPESDDQGDAEEATDQEKLTALQEGGQDSTQLESEHKSGEPEPKQAAKKPRKKRRGKGPKLAPGQREYTILRLYGEAEYEKTPHGKLWEEALPEPVVARSGELALRKAFRILSENKPGNYELVPIPTKYWNPEEVEGEVPDTALAIKVGGKKK